jgi:D-3-phosphoglycerate dehydrogenase
LLRPLLQDVNMVSAPALLKERGAPLTESTRDDSPTYDSLIRVKVKTGGGWRTLAGTLVGGQPRIVEVKGMALEAPFHALTLYTNNADKPGFIGALGTLLGDAGVNIATFHLGRDAAGGEAIALVGIDQPPTEGVLAKVKSLPHVRYAKLLRF